MRAKDLDRIRRWRDSGGLRRDAIVEAARKEYAPVYLSEFVAVNSSAQVNAAYTGRAWKEGIEPLIAGLQTMVAETKDSDLDNSLKRFLTDFRAETLKQWNAFLTEAVQVDKAPGADFPYDRIIDSANSNLAVILGDAWERGEIPAWALTLRNYVQLKASLVKAQKSGKDVAQADGKGDDASKFLAAYLSATRQLRSELSTTETSFASAKKAFTEGEPSETATHPALKASWALEMLRASMGKQSGEDRLIWLLLARPVTLSWKAILEESGRYLQQQWEGLLLEVKWLDSESRGSKVLAFVNTSAAVFLTPQGGTWAPKRVLDQAVPFTPAFIQYHSRLRREAISGGILSATPFPGSPPPPYIARVS
jgi:hypothetical protein